MGLAINTVERYVIDSTRHIRGQLHSFCPPDIGHVDKAGKPIIP
jgi:RNA polymerase sigma-70 factor (ECF subfamily)